MTLKASTSSFTAPSACALALKPSSRLLCLLTLSLLLCACRKPPFSQPQRLGGVEVSADTLNLGHTLYTQRCSTCHGLDGRGHGPQAPLQTRDLTQALFKYKSTPLDALPTHDDLTRTIGAGIPSRMPSFLDSLSPPEIDAVAHFIKTLSPRWASESPPPPLLIPPDPFPDLSSRALAADTGRILYHTHLCWQCHPAFVPEPLLRQWLSDARIDSTPLSSRLALAPLDKQPPMHLSASSMLPPDLLNAKMRAGSTDADLYRTLTAGISPAGMLGLSNTLSPAELWSLVHYLRRLQAQSQSHP
jgi:mono/diheme cytochrome c family protein